MKTVIMRVLRKKRAGFTPTPESPAFTGGDEWQESAKRKSESHGCKPMVWGFTLLEVLVVISIIAILASAIFASLGIARARARDAQREEEIKSLQTALALYVTEGGSFPVWSSDTTASKRLICVMSPGLPPGGNDIFDALNTKRSLNAPICDPMNDTINFYEYKTTDTGGSSYEILYRLETESIRGKNPGLQPPVTP